MIFLPQHTRHTPTNQPNNGMTLTLLQRVVLFFVNFFSRVKNVKRCSASFTEEGEEASMSPMSTFIHIRCTSFATDDFRVCVWVSLMFQIDRMLCLSAPHLVGCMYIVQWLLRRLYLSISFFPIISHRLMRQSKTKEMKM